ncbi:hypothetical protein [Chryseobacterium sp. IHB B 17019]|uniref:hypothetical protein n=1 Tax=Chryseobacterium sp. IHB B 17019 TaxID=1721091 RepID=UPI000A530D39|nr:hypothetical protein [Chryseobacterium sp. IHB B 17019]
MKIPYYFILIILFFFHNCSKSSETKKGKERKDDYYEKCRLLVLSENKIGKKYFFSRLGKNVDEATVEYLGQIYTSNNGILKIVNMQNIVGYPQSKRGNSYFFIYDNNDNLLGSYYVGSLWGVPKFIDSKGYLIFNYNNESCDQSTKINLKDSIPKNIYIKCSKDGGDFYTLSLP